MKHPGDLLSAYLDGELPPDERAAVAAHLEGCTACREELDGVGAARRTLRDLPVVEPPAELIPEPAGRRWGLRPAWGWAAAGAAALAVTIGLVVGAAQEPPTLDLDTFADQHTARVIVQPGIQTVRAVVEGP